VLARDRILAPEFSSIEEWLGRNTLAYYQVLADVGAGSWQPSRDASTWIRFNLRAHHMQAQTVLRRADESSRLWEELERLVAYHGLPERTLTMLYNAALGYRTRRTQYEKDAQLEVGTAGRDIRMMSAAGLIEPRGQTRGRHYLGTLTLRSVWQQVRKDRARLDDPYAPRRSRVGGQASGG